MSTTNDWPQYRRDIQYSNESRLNSLEWCIPRPTSNDSTQVWIVYIHGGAWRDPAIDCASFRKTQNLLLVSKEIEHVAGLASINYRLSPYPSHPDDPSNPSDPARNARHPDHINDVLAALLHLQETFRFEDRYILVGHSCGATLALQVAMRRYWGSQYESTFALELNVVPPVAVLGVEGIYDVPALLKYHKKEPAYEDFISNAFGPDEATWISASPSHGDYNDSWPDGKLVVLAHSRNDGLVEWEQLELLCEAFKAQGWDHESRERRVSVLELKGEHDEIWQDGKELARAIRTAVQQLQSLS